jgi:hypothetical protein
MKQKQRPRREVKTNWTLNKDLYEMCTNRILHNEKVKYLSFFTWNKNIIFNFFKYVILKLLEQLHQLLFREC